VDLQPITVVYGYTLSTGSWVKLSEVLGEPYKSTIVDQTFLGGEAQPELNAVHTASGLPAVSLGFFVSSSMDFLEAHGDAIDGSWRIMRSHTTGAVNQTPSSLVLEEIETSPEVFDPLITIDNYTTATWDTLDPKFASLDGVQVSNLADDPPGTYGSPDALGRLEQLLHVAGNNAYFRVGSGNSHTWRYEGASHVFGDVALGPPLGMFVSKDGTRLHVSNPVSEEHEIWVAGVKRLTWPILGVPAIGSIMSLNFPTYRSNNEIIAGVREDSGDKTRVVRVTDASGSWEAIPGAYVPPSVNLSSGPMVFEFRCPARCVPGA
jgi:hypothetical protein